MVYAILRKTSANTERKHVQLLTRQHQLVVHVGNYCETRVAHLSAQFFAEAWRRSAETAPLPGIRAT